MYSARAVNASPTYVHVNKELRATEAVIPAFGGVLTSRKPDFDLRGRDAWIFISIKNRGFNRPYINRFIDLCEELDLNGHVCPVDDPYRYNSMAELKRDDLPQEEVDKIERLSTDISRMVEKAIRGKCTKRVDLVKWRDLEAATPSIYREELTRAFRQKTRIRNMLHEHVTSVKTCDTERDFERYAEFFLCEVPVLMHTYYAHGPTLDIYPGPQPKFFWQIELGHFEKELPQLTALTRAERAFLYLDTHDRTKPKK